MAWYAAATSAFSYQVALEPQGRTESDLTIGALTTYNTPEPLTLNPQTQNHQTLNPQTLNPKPVSSCNPETLDQGVPVETPLFFRALLGLFRFRNV